MMDLLNKNLKFLNEKYPGMADLIEEKKEELLDQEQLEVMTEINFEGEEILKVRRNGRQLYLAGRRSAQAAVDNQIGALGKIEQAAPVFMVGMGNIHYLETLLEQTGKENVVMLYEPSFSIFYAQIHRIDIEEIFKDRLIVLAVGGLNDTELKPIMSSMLRGDRVPFVKHFILPNYKEICLEQIRQFQQELTQEAKTYLTGANTERRFSTVFVDNVFHNANYVRTGYQARQLVGIFPKDMPAIIVSAGPSLNKNIEELKRAKNKAFIIAVDTAIKPLLAHGIVPDMFAIIDGLKPVELVQVEGSRNIPLLSATSAAHSVLDYHQGKKFFFCQNYRFIDRMYQINEKTFGAMQAGGSVATMAFSLVCHLNFKCVIFVGQDLALTGNKTHADGTFKEKMEEEDTSNYKMVPGNVEEMVPTRPDFNGYRIWFEDYIDMWKNRYPDFRVINATEGGARIKGTEIMSLKDAIDQECKTEEDVSAKIRELEPMFNAEEQKKILDYLHDTPKEFHQIALNAQTGRKLYRKLEKMANGHNADRAAYEKLLKQIKKNTLKIERSCDYHLVEESLAVANQILGTAQHFEYRDFEEECRGIADRGIKYMDLVEECATLLGDFSQEIFGKIEE